MQKLISRSLAGIALAPLLYGPAAYADGPPEAYDNGTQAERGLKPDDYLVNADGAREDPKAKMSEIARAYRNGWIHRGNTDDRILKAVIQKQHDEQMAAAREAARRVSEMPPGVPARRRYLPPPPPSYTAAPPPEPYAPPMYASPPPAPVQYVAVYAPPPPPVQPVQYVPVYQQPGYGQPVVAVATAYPVVQAGYYGAPWWYGGGYRRWR